jgi:hypothetical protein
LTDYLARSFAVLIIHFLRFSVEGLTHCGFIKAILLETMRRQNNKDVMIAVVVGGVF